MAFIYIKYRGPRDFYYFVYCSLKAKRRLVKKAEKILSNWEILGNEISPAIRMNLSSSHPDYKNWIKALKRARRLDLGVTYKPEGGQMCFHRAISIWSKR